MKLFYKVFVFTFTIVSCFVLTKCEATEETVSTIKKEFEAFKLVFNVMLDTMWDRLEALSTGAQTGETVEETTTEAAVTTTTTIPTTTTATRETCSAIGSFVSYVTLPSFYRDYAAMYCKDPLSTNDKTYYMSGFVSGQLVEFQSETDFLTNNNPTTHTLPVMCDGGQSIVVGGRFYCSETNAPNILVYDLSDVSSVAARISLQNIQGSTVGIHNTCAYGFGGFSDIDMEHDETGLYAVWGRSNENCKMAISKINVTSNEIENTWFTTYSKKGNGGAIMACGKLYKFYSFRGDTRVTFIFDTATGEETTNSNIEFKNLYSQTFHVHYDQREQKLFTWDNRYPVKVSVQWAGA